MAHRVRILIDECVNPRVCHAFPNHTVLTVTDAGWRTLSDRELIEKAQGQCDVFVTIDHGFEVPAKS